MTAKRRVSSFSALFCMILIAGSAVYGSGRDDLADAFAYANSMVRFIQSGDASSSQEAGNRAMTALEKAIDATSDSDKRSKMRDAVGELRKALSHVGNKEWPYAEGAAKRAADLIDDLL